MLEKTDGAVKSANNIETDAILTLDTEQAETKRKPENRQPKR